MEGKFRWGARGEDTLLYIEIREKLVAVVVTGVRDCD